MGKRANRKNSIDRAVTEAFRELGSGLMGASVPVYRDFGADVYRLFVTGEYRERRGRAIKNIFNRVRAEISGDRKDYCGMDISELFARSELLPFDNYNVTDRLGSLRTAAAIWMLEELSFAGKLKDAVSKMPDMREILDAEKWPHPFGAEHAMFPARLVETMALAITFRYMEKGSGLGNVYRFKSCVIPKELVEKKALSGWYKEILAMLPAKHVETACNRFREQAWESLELFIKMQACLLKRFDYYIKKTDKAFTKVTAPVNAPVALLADAQKAVPDIETGAVSRVSPGYVFDGVFPWIPRIGNEDMFQWSKDFTEAEDILSEFVTGFHKVFGMEKEELLAAGLDESLAERFCGFKPENPYETCFALFYLLDNDDDLAWLLRTSGAYVSYAETFLPWYDAGLCSRAQIPFSAKRLETMHEDIAEARKGIKDIGHDYYGLSHDGLSLAQVLYRVSGTVIPCSGSGFTGIMKKLLGSRADDEALVKHMAEMAGVLGFKRVAGAVSCIADNAWEEAEAAEAEEKQAEEPEDGPVAVEDADSLRLELVKAKEALKQSRKDAALLRGKMKALEAGKLKLQEEYDRDRRELADLREVVFNTADNSIADDADGGGISYPHEFTRKVVVFGGHDSFLKVMKGNFPNVRFVDVDKISFNPEIVRNADVVWIQNNNISHPQYWNIVKTARQYGRQVRYFTTGGTAACSRQLVESEEAV